MRRPALAVLCAAVLLLIVAASQPTAGSLRRVAAQDPLSIGPLCREDGICLPVPRLAGEPRAAEAAQVPRLECEMALLVKRAEDVAAADMSAQLQNAGYTRREGLLVPQWWRVCVNSPEVIEDEIDALRAMPGVLAVAEETYRQISAFPNDPYFTSNEQWGLPKIGAPNAWTTTTGSNNVLIAVVDTGMDYAHADRPAELWLGWDFVDGDGYPYDLNGHGTHVMGIAAAATNNNIGVAGLCPDCSTLAIRVLDADGRGYTSDVADGIAEAAWVGDYLGKLTVINVSIGGPCDPLEADAVAYAQSLGALVVAAAGNDGPKPPDCPAAHPGVLAVSATGSNDSPAGYSQYGQIAAPGSSVLSTVPTWLSAPPYGLYSGTSMASPLTAAAAGLVWSRYPTFTASQVSERLLDTVDLPAGWNTLYGAGRLNVASAVGQPMVLDHWLYLPMTVR